jgi:hypothetical protein
MVQKRVLQNNQVFEFQIFLLLSDIEVNSIYNFDIVRDLFE